ncbi:MAG: ureidoglycolate lyase [Chromatocurvus sp.]
MSGQPSAHSLALEPLSAAAFAPFGEVIEPGGATREYDINDGQTRRYHDIARARALHDAAAVTPDGASAPAAADGRDAGQAPEIGFSIFRARPVTLPCMLQRMERHPLGSQAFINVSSVAYAIVVAPPGTFDPDRLRAFLAAPGQSINYRAGTWHHYLLALGRGDFVVVDRIGDGNCDEVELPVPVRLVAARDDGGR